MANSDDSTVITIFCRRLQIVRNEPGLQWLVGSPFFPSFTIISTFRCIHTLPSDPLSPDFSKESDDARMLLPKGFEVIGALIVSAGSNNEKIGAHAIRTAREMRRLLHNNENSMSPLVAGVMDLNKGSGDITFFVASGGKSGNVESVSSVVYQDEPEKYVWESGCLLQCELPLRLPLYYRQNNPTETGDEYVHAIEAVSHKLGDPQVTYLIEALNETENCAQPVVLCGMDLDIHRESSNAILTDESQESDAKSLLCSYFCTESKGLTSFNSVEENADKIQVSILFNRSRNSAEPVTPTGEYYPATEEAKLLVVDHKLQVLCYVKKDLKLTCAISKLLIPALVDQLHSMKKKILPSILTGHPQLHPYHFLPSPYIHPITVIYDLSYGETEMKQVEVRRSLHYRLGLPVDRPLLRVSNAMNLTEKHNTKAILGQKGKGSFLLKDVHLGIPNSGVAGGMVSLMQGSYEYHHYLQDGYDDSGWGCAYRSLQTIISWFRLQNYASIDIPSHREIQQSLVDIGDKDPSFVGSCEWIGAIELSFVLDKLLGVSCKIINVRSGAELPEKCRELALHFENQGTPVMIGGGVLAYTLLGVDYNEANGDCAFLILDPHYTGSDDLKKIINGGWCGWKKAIDNRGKHFFLHDKFYNLLLPQRPEMV